MSVSLVTPDDFQTLLSVFRRRGLKFLLQKLKLSGSERVKKQWDTYQTSGSNWWEVPAIRQRWNFKITGNEEETWEEYVSRKYILNQADFRVLSVGCGSGEKERLFASYVPLMSIEGIDISENSVRIAREKARNANNKNLVYHVGDFTKFSFEKEKFDVVLFNSSLHHFRKIEELIANKVLPVLKPGGKVIIFEYTGPNRFQYTGSQLAAANGCLTLLTSEFKKRSDNSIKQKVYRPGWLRMWLNDPSEAPCSEEILPMLRQHLTVVEEKALGGSLLHPLMKGIAHNFLGGKSESSQLLDMLFHEEDKFYDKTGQSDFWFGVYRKDSTKQNND
jgi:ubiquinone/menaquinone biosynthesis C-methylase UbiE